VKNRRAGQTERTRDFSGHFYGHESQKSQEWHKFHEGQHGCNLEAVLVTERQKGKGRKSRSLGTTGNGFKNGRASESDAR
jgi:hypothetical protein